jgi:hypothetical protein
MAGTAMVLQELERGSPVSDRLGRRSRISSCSIGVTATSSRRSIFSRSGSRRSSGCSTTHLLGIAAGAARGAAQAHAWVHRLATRSSEPDGCGGRLARVPDRPCVQSPLGIDDARGQRELAVRRAGERPRRLTSRVSNFGPYSPLRCFRAPRQTDASRDLESALARGEPSSGGGTPSQVAISVEDRFISIMVSLGLASGAWARRWPAA